jgi:DNA (cytosine-5)-methyltransferase 1
MKEKEILEATQILEGLFLQAKQIYLNEASQTEKIKKNFSEISNEIDTLLKFIDSNKSLISVLITSCIKKIVSPNQDIRLHRIDFENGYSGRSLDTFVTTPFFKKHFPRYANKETGFLTLATREKIKWTLDNGQALKIRRTDVKNSFLRTIDKIQKSRGFAQICAVYTILCLYEATFTDSKVLEEIKNTKINGVLNINLLIQMVEEHFNSPRSSRLPVIAIFSIYEELFKLSLTRYNNKTLLPLNVHTSSDKHSFGDIEIYNSDETPFEIIEIKHNIPISESLILDIVKKIENTGISRYHILTTFKNSFKTEDEEKAINKLLLKIKKKYEFDIIANGIIHSMKYYLRLFDSYENFIHTYTFNLIKDFENSTEIEQFHIDKWKEIISRFQITKQGDNDA